MNNNNRNDMISMVRRALVCCLMFWCFTGQALAQNDPQYVIMYDGHYLAHVYNTTENKWELQDATNFSPNCLWFSSNNYNYYFNDGTNLRYLSAPLEPNGVLSLSDSYPGTQVLNNNTLDYFFYDWDGGLARGIEHTLDDCDPIYNGQVGTQCWEVVWVSYENNQWKMSSVYGYNQPTTAAADFYPVTVFEHAQEVSSETGGVGNLTDLEMDYPSTEHPSITVNDYSYTYTPAYTTYVFNGGTHNYYNNTDNGTSTPGSTTSSNNTVSGYNWTITGEGATYLTLTNATTATPTLAYNTTENTTGHKTATLTVTVTYSDGGTQVRTASVLVKTACQNPGLATPVVNYEGVTLSWVNTSDHYKLYWRKDTESDYTNSIEVYDANSYTLTELASNTTYYYKVSAFCGGIEITSPPPTEGTFTTAIDPHAVIYGAVFGGGRMANVTGNTNVVIINCDTLAAVYGGNDIAGVVEGANGSTITLGVNADNTYAIDYNNSTASVKVNIGDVYGGGNGYYAYNGSTFQSATDRTYTVASGASVTALSENGWDQSVWTNTGADRTLTLPDICKSTIVVTNDVVKVDSLFGGAKNAFMGQGTEGKGSNITVNGGTIFAVFGGNNVGGGQGNGLHNVTVNATKTTTASLTPNVTSTATTGYGRDFGIRYLFGGGNKVYGSTTNVIINGGQCDTIFAGGNSADVYAANLTVNCEIAAGSGNNTFGKVYSSAISSYSSSIAINDSYDWDGTGVYNVHTLFGGNNQATMEGIPNVTLTSGSVGTVYGGGNAGDMVAQATDNGSGGTLTINGDNVKYSTHVKMSSANMVVDYIYGGCQVSNVHYSTWVEMENGHVGTVFGGCNVSGDVGSTRLDLDAPQWLDPPTNTIANENYQKVYGGTYVVASGGTVYKSLFAGGNGFYHCVDSHGHYVSGLNYADPEEHYIGLSTPTHNETHVVVSGSITVKGNVYAGGNLACVGFNNSTVEGNPYPVFVGLSSVRMSGGTINGNVFGGGNMANVYGSNEIQVSGGTIDKSLYGGNDRTGAVAQISNRVLPVDYSTASDGATSLLEPKVYTYIGLTGTPTITNVYGGGNGYYAYFSTFEQAQAYTGLLETVVTCELENQPIQRCTFVDVGIDGGENGGHIGTVYGGGDGVTVNEFLKVFLNVQNNPIGYSNVGTIFGGNNKGDLALVPDIILLNGQVNTVYGGCNQGAMTGGKNVTVGSNTYNNVGSYVRLLKEYDPDGAGTAYSAVNTNAKVVNAVYGGCKMNGVTNNSMVSVEGGNHSGVGIFGGSDISGTIGGTSRVVVDGATAVVGNVFGGGNGDYDYTSTYSGYNKPSSATSRVDMLAGTATNLFAGGNACGSGATVMQVEGGNVTTGIYGGSNSSGTITNATSVNVVGGTVNKVFGGGKGENTAVNGNVTVTIGNTTGGPTVNGNVYGGSEQGIVNDASSDLTQVNILNGNINADVYGGGQGIAGESVKGRVNGKVEVNIGSCNDNGTPSDPTDDTYSGTAMFGNTSKVFGCNDAGESPQDDVTVNIYSTGHNSTNSYPDPAPSSAVDLVGASASQFAIQAVYGGGNLADYAPENGSASSTKKTTVHVYGCDENTIKDVFGGSNQASAQNTHVIIDGGRINRTFGGGNGEVGPAPVVGTAKTDIYAGLITQVFGGSNTNGNIGTIDLNIFPSNTCRELIYEVFSGNNQAPLFGNMVTNLVGECFNSTNPKEPDGYNFYGGTNLAPIYGDVTLNVYGGYYVNVFGGSKGYIDPLSPVDPTNNISANIMRVPTLAEVNANPGNYPDGLRDYIITHPEAVGTGGNVTLNLYGGKIENAFGGSDVLGEIEGKITVNVLEGGGESSINHCPLDLEKVYGGGKETRYTPLTDIVGIDLPVPEVNIIKGTVKKDVFGGGLGATATVTGNPVVTIGDITSGHETYVATVGEASTRYGNVYGGGELAQVNGSTNILIQKANSVIEGTVYGGGKGSSNDVNHGLVKGNTWVEMTGGHVRRSIYGGGELGSVGTFTALYAANEHPLHVAGEPKTCADETGITKVTVSGGMVGLNEALMPSPNDPVLDDDFGYIFCAGKGLSDSITYPLANLLAVSDSSYLEISGTAVITGAVYGGSENGQLIHGTYVKIKGGQIGTGHYKDGSGHHWDGLYEESQWTAVIDQIQNGTFTGTNYFHQCDAWPFKPEGQRYVYDHYAKYGPDSEGNYYYDQAMTESAHGGSHSAGDGHSYYGNVFGGGSGYYPYAPGKWRRWAGRVCGNTLVEVVGGHILTNIYGGNEITDVLGHSKVVMKGGTLGVPRSLDSITARPVNSYIFGGGMGDPRNMFNDWSNVGSAEVIVDSVAVIFGSIFGGGEDGHVLGDVTTTIQGNTLIGTLGTSSVDGNVFGGGRGFSGTTLTAGVVCGNVTVNIGGNAKLLGSVFGGGRLAAVGTYLDRENESNYGLLQPDTPEKSHGNITVNITGGTIGNPHHLNDTEYSIGDVFGGSKGTWKYDAIRNQRLGLAKNTTVNISQATGNTTTIYGSVYGGGEIASVGSFTYATVSDTTNYNPTHPTEPMTVGDVYSWVEGGVATVNITGGIIGQSSLANTKGNVFGSCLGKAGKRYSGYSFVDKSYVTVNGSTIYGSVFGGGENGHVLHDTDVKIQNGTIGTRMDNQVNPPDNIIFRGNVYGGGRGIDEVTDGSRSTATYSITAGKVSGNTNVTVTGGTIYRNVYGGGSFASVGDPDENPANGNFTTGLSTVTINGGTIGTDGGKNANTFDASGEQHRNNLKENGFVFGSGRGLSGAEGSVYDSLAYVNNSVVNIGGTAYVTGSVFGGGENGHVKNHTLVNVTPSGSFKSESLTEGDFATYNYISENTEPYPVIGYPLTRDDMVENLAKPRVIYRGNVYGGGRGIDPKDEHGNLSENAGVVYGNTEVRITGGTIRHDVYGGGSVASVGTLTYDYSHNDSVTSIHPHTGNASVFISGGIIGIDSTLDIVKVLDGSTLLHNLAGVNNGQVYGGGRGQSDTLFKNLAYVDSTHVEISGGVIYGAVFGGGCNGHVKRDTYVKMTGGTIGHTLSDLEKNSSFQEPEPVYFGNVYGGGRGIDHTNLPGTISHTAGQVYGNTRVDISGGRVHNDVYGGGSLANVGVERYDAQGNVVGITAGGYAYVNITGNAIIGTDGKNAGFVYGSGRGRAGETWSDMAYVDMTFVTIGTENGSDNPQVRGSVFGGGSNGHVEDDTDVKIYRGIIGTPLTAAEMVEADPILGTERPRVYRGNVYGGGRGVERSGSKTLSPTAGRVFGNTNVSVYGGTIYHNVYGGGSLASVGTFTIENNQHVFADTTGKATVTISGGTIGMSADVLTSLSLSTNYSGLNNGQVYGSGRGEAGAEYANFAFVKETEVNISGGSVFGAVFGGGANGHVNEQTQVNVSGGTIGIDDINQGTFNVYRGNVYGGGRGIDLDNTHQVSATAGKVYGNTNVEVTGGTIYHNVFGGGSLASVGTTTGTAPNLVFADNTGDATVTIDGGTIGVNSVNNGLVFGSGRGYPNPDMVTLTYVNNTQVNVLNGNIKGCVFGSGDNGQVYNNTNVNVSGGTIGTSGGPTDGNIFGSGRGSDTYLDEHNTAQLNPISGLVHNCTHVNMSGGTIKNNIYGGGFMASVSDTAFVYVGGVSNVGVSSNPEGGKVFGGSRGDADNTELAKVDYTEVTINADDATMQNNIYGGGEEGIIVHNTKVIVNSGVLYDVYGAGQGVANAAGASANIGDATCVVVNNGTIRNLYGGGQNGTVHYGTSKVNPPIATEVTINNGTIKENVFGGGDQGTTTGRVIVNMNGGTVSGELFGGAKGTTGSVFVAGLKTVNMRGGLVENHVYGGSRNANDGMDLSQTLANANTVTEYTSFVNISAGEIRGNVYGAGYYGHMFGSSDINIGKDAIYNANDRNIDRGTHTTGKLHIFTHVYAGSNWGEYNPAAGFGRSTTTGHSNIYLDGNGYNTQTVLTSEINYMNIEGSLYGSGTSCDAGSRGRKIQVANYGAANTGPQTMEDITFKGATIPNVLQAATRTFQSIQRCDTLIFDNSSVEFTGQGDISQNFNTAEYSLFYIDKGVWVRNGSNLVGNKQFDEIHALYSEYRPGNDLYDKPSDQTVYWIGIGDNDYSFHYLTKGASPSEQGELNDQYINTIRVNNGYALYVRYTKLYTLQDNGSGIMVGSMVELNDPITGISDALRYGELNGFFRIAVSDSHETFAHARPKVTESTPNLNTADGGFMSYYNEGHNIFDRDNGTAYTKGLQFPYTNMLASAKVDRPDYRFWQVTATDDKTVNYDAVLYLYSQPESTDDFLTVEYEIELPTLACTDGYYELFDIDYGDNVRIVDGGIYMPEDNDHYYIVYDGNNIYHHTVVPKSTTDNVKLNEAKAKMLEKPNTRFGLVVVPDGCLALNTDNKPIVLSNNAKPYIIPNGTAPGQKLYYPANPNGQTPKVKLRVTYYKELTQSVTLAPVVISMKSYCGSSTVSTNDINIEATFTTQTALGQDVNVTAYAMYDNIATNEDDETYRLKVTLPAFIAPANSGGHETPFYIYQEEYSHAPYPQIQEHPTFMASSSIASYYSNNSDREYAITYTPADNADNKNGWAHSTIYTNHELNLTGNAINPAVMTNPVKVGEADGRIPISIDFTLHYNSVHVDVNNLPNPYEAGDVGVVTFKVCYPNTAGTLDDPVPANIGGTDVPEGWKRFNINFTIYKKTFSRGFFLDGIKGDDAFSGNYADHGLRSIQGVLDNGWTPGDNVLVVRPITVTSNTVWSNSNGYTIALYRYPGDTKNNHHDELTSQYNSLDPGENTGHNEYAGNQGLTTTSAAFFIVDGSSANLNLDSFILDGMNGGDIYPFLEQPPTDPNVPEAYDWTLPEHLQEQQAPLIDIIRGKVSLSNCQLRYSQNKSADALGGAIRVADGATLNINSGTVITNNKLDNASNNGAGIYVEDGATVNLKGLINITGNLDASGQENNVYLESLNTTLTIDKNNGLNPNSTIGIYKTEFYTEGDMKDLTPIATSAFNSRIKEAYINKNFTDDTRRGYIFHYFDATTLYMGKTWAHYQITPPDNFAVNDINSAEDLAWFISYVNGLNGSDPHPTAIAKLTADIPGSQLNQHYWLPIEDFKGTFDGQWHKIDGLTMRREGFEDMGLFGHVTGDGSNNGVVKNVLMTSSDIQPWNPDEGIEQHVGGIAGRVSNGGIVTGCQALPTIDATDANRSTYIGGVVGEVDNGGIVHSVIGMPTLTGYTMGGIAGKIEVGGNLYNSYSNIAAMTSKGSGFIGGLVGYNSGTVENNYSQTRTITLPSNFGWFAGRNGGSIRYCYAPENESVYNYVNNEGSTLGNHGNYETNLLKRKEIGYLYDDNKVIMASGQSNTYHSDVITYANSHIDKWPGMVSALDHWAKEKNDITDTSDPLYGKHFARWYRPGTANINGDFPVLGLYGHNTMATDNTNPLLLDYGSDTTSSDKHTSLDNLLTKYSTVPSSLFVYGNAIDVTQVPSPNAAPPRPAGCGAAWLRRRAPGPRRVRGRSNRRRC